MSVHHQSGHAASATAAGPSSSSYLSAYGASADMPHSNSGNPSSNDSISPTEHLAPQSIAPGQASSSTGKQPKAAPPLARGSACSVCRKRKLRCDGQKPACGTCQRLKHECVYGDPAHEKLQDKNRELQKRIEMLEEELERARTQPELSSPRGAPLSARSSHEASTYMPSNAGSSTQNNQSPWSASTHQTPVGGQFSDSQAFPLPVVAGESRSPLESSQAFPISTGLPSMLETTTTQTGFDPFPPTPSTSGSAYNHQTRSAGEMLPNGWAMALPPFELVLELTDIYFRTMGLHLPFLHRPRFLYSIHHPASLQSAPSLSLIFAVVAAAAPYHDDPQVRDRAGFWYDRSREKVFEATDGSLTADGVSKATLTVETVQTLCILTSIDMGRNDHQRAFIGIGAAMRSCVMLGLHRMDEDRIAAIEGTRKETRLRPPALHRLPEDSLLLEECRRTMCAVFTLDRCQSACLGWPACIHEGDLRLLLPCSDDRFENGTCLIDGQDNPIWWPTNDALREREHLMSPLSSFAWLCRTLWLGGRIQRQTYRPMGNPWPGPLDAPSANAPLNDVEKVLEADHVLHEIRSQVTILASKNAQKGVDIPLVMVLIILNCLSINLHHLRVMTLLTTLPFDPAKQVLLGSGEYSLQQCLEACRAILEIVSQISAYENIRTTLHQSRVGVYSTFLPYLLYCFAFPAKFLIGDWNIIATNRTVNSSQQGGLVPNGSTRVPPGDAVFGEQFDDFRLDFVDAIADVLGRLAPIWTVSAKFRQMVRNDQANLMGHIVERRRLRSPQREHQMPYM